MKLWSWDFGSFMPANEIAVDLGTANTLIYVKGEGIVLNKDGSLQRTARFRGPDLDSAVPAELVAVAGRLTPCSSLSMARALVAPRRE